MTTHVARANCRCVTANLIFAWFLLLSAIGAFADQATTNDASELIGASPAELVKRSAQHYSEGKVDLAMQEVSLAIQLDSNNVPAYEMRGAYYVNQKLWDRAERDIATADKIAPDVSYKYKLGEIKFLQKKYDDARPRFAALRDDPRLGDLATYKVILCDLFGRHETMAARDIAELDPIEKKPSYYFGHAAFELVNGKRPDANKWFAQAQHLFSTGTFELYIASLAEVQPVQLPIASFVTRDGQTFEHAHISLETAGLRASSAKGWVTVPLDQLPDDLSAFPEDMRKEIFRRLAAATDRSTPTSFLSFTTTSGKQYDQVRWTVQDSGLAVLTAEGWITVPFDQLPSDSSSFPPELQKKIADKHAAQTSHDVRVGVVSFATKSGQTYDQVQATAKTDGLAILTSNGWITVPFRELPDDLSPFPAEWRPKIETGRSHEDSPAVQRLSFTARDGTHYDDVRSILEPDALRVLSTQGWVRVPFNQLPIDLSSFPETWRATIAAKQNETSPNGPAANNRRVVSTSDLHPPFAKDCNFGSSVALENSTLVVGSRGAAYVYIDGRLQARLCSNADSTDTGDPVISVAISDRTIVTSTPRGIFIWVRESQEWVLQASLPLANSSTVAIDGDNLLAVVDGKGAAPNSVYYYVRQGKQWQPVTRLSEPEKDTFSADKFGCVAALFGSEAVIGIPDWSNASYLKGTAASSGRASVERYDGTAWNQETLLAPADLPTGENQFGSSIALSDDFAAISSGNHDTIDYTSHHGSVYLFRRAMGGWQPDAVLKGPDPTADAGFGNAPISLWHRTLAVGDCEAKAHANNVILDTGERTGKPGTINHVGAVYLFESHDLRATLTAPDPAESLNRRGSPDRFASSLALDDDTIAAGAPGKNGGTGAVYVWKREKDQWRLESEIKGFHKQLDFDY